MFYIYGVYIHGQWIPLLDTWLFGVFELLYIVGPLTLYLSFCITPSTQLYAPRRTSPEKTIATPLDKNVFYFPPRHQRRTYPLHRNATVRMLVAASVLYQFINIFFIGYFSNMCDMS